MDRRKSLVLSIDSACWEYLDPPIEKGRMPNVARLVGSGVRGVLESTMPPITPVAFSSFITGTNPGKHGIFDWTVRDAEGNAGPASAAVRRGAPFWRYLNRAGVRVGLFNIPLTYPPQPVEGFVVPGITVPRDARDLTYPTEVLARMEAQCGPYHVEVERSLLDQGVGPYTAAWLEHEALQTDLALALMDAYDVDVLVLNYAALDRVNHFSPYREHLQDVLANVDAQIGRFVERYPEANFVLMSDHGSRRIHSAFLLGKWLAQNGYAIYGERSLDVPRHEANFALARALRAQRVNGRGEKVLRGLLRGLLAVTPSRVRRVMWEAMYRAAPQALEYRFSERLDWKRTRVFATSNSGPLFINTTDGRTTYADVREGLMRDLLTVRDPATGDPVFAGVYRREEIYHGPMLTRAPDLIADHYGSACDLIVDSKPGTFCFVNRLNRFGDHRREGIFVLSGPDFVQAGRRAQRASIVDLPATLLHLHGVPVPDDFDGRVLEEFLAAGFTEEHPVRKQEAVADQIASGIDYGEADQAEVMERLRQLGYL